MDESKTAYLSNKSIYCLNDEICKIMFKNVKQALNNVVKSRKAF